jgi:phenylpropionate dioxygenase-like ring-hydroxylating dioxygenase large terminal subunit
VNLDEQESKRIAPFELPYFEQKGFSHIRLINHFRNNVTNCVENFVDIPHTVFVHPTIFRKEKKTKQRIGVKVERVGGSVIVNYQMETDNFGAFSWFLNPKGQEIFHQDSFHMPNVTHVEYIFGPHRHFNIISQSVPIGHGKTTVYTDLIYNYGIWNSICKPIIAWQAQKIIDQDVEVLNNQWLTLEKFGHQFMNSPVDIIHILIESIRNEIEKGQDPTKLEPRTCEAEFWI